MITKCFCAGILPLYKNCPMSSYIQNISFHLSFEYHGMYLSSNAPKQSSIVFGQVIFQANAWGYLITHILHNLRDLNTN